MFAIPSPSRINDKFGKGTAVASPRTFPARKTFRTSSSESNRAFGKIDVAGLQRRVNPYYGRSAAFPTTSSAKFSDNNIVATTADFDVVPQRSSAKTARS